MIYRWTIGKSYHSILLIYALNSAFKPARLLQALWKNAPINQLHTAYSASAQIEAQHALDIFANGVADRNQDARLDYTNKNEFGLPANSRATSWYPQAYKLELRNKIVRRHKKDSVPWGTLRPNLSRFRLQSLLSPEIKALYSGKKVYNFVRRGMAKNLLIFLETE